MDIPTFEYNAGDFISQTAQWVDKMAPQESKFDKQLVQQWEAAVDAGAFRYTVDQIDVRTISGPKKYVALLNVLRSTERRKPQEITSIKQPVNPDAFNFTKVKSSEIIFDLKHKTDTKKSNGCLPGGQENGTEHSRTTDESTHSIIINSSPVNKGHCLLVPERNLCRPQVLTETAVKVAMETILLSQNRS